jgi:signal transduction histidine kinase
MSPDLRAIERRATSALREYLQSGEESALLAAYDLGHDALAEGMGIHDVARILHRAAWASGAPLDGQHSEEAIRRVEEFILETLSPFEMAHRSVGEANQLLHRLNDVLEEEIRRVAHELHDHAGQLLVSVHLELDDVARNIGPGGRERLQQVRQHLDAIHEQLRLFSHELRPTILDDLGLMPALRFVCDRISRRSGLAIAVAGDSGGRRARRVETAMYRIVQEALANTAKHAHATSATVIVESAVGCLRCTVEDDGVGFDSALAAGGAGHPGLGLLGIRERLANLGGQLRIEPRAPRGTRLVAEVPLASDNGPGPGASPAFSQAEWGDDHVHEDRPRG